MQNIITSFNPEAKPYRLCMHVNGYKCFMYHDLDDSFNIKKTYIDFVFPVQEINCLVAEFKVEFSHDKQAFGYKPKQAVLWFGSGKQNVIMQCTSKELEQVSEGFDLNNNNTTKTQLLLSYLTGLVSEYWFTVTCLDNVKGELY